MIATRSFGAGDLAEVATFALHPSLRKPGKCTGFDLHGGQATNVGRDNSDAGQVSNKSRHQVRVQ